MTEIESPWTQARNWLVINRKHWEREKLNRAEKTPQRDGEEETMKKQKGQEPNTFQKISLYVDGNLGPRR